MKNIQNNKYYNSTTFFSIIIIFNIFKTIKETYYKRIIRAH